MALHTAPLPVRPLGSSSSRISRSCRADKASSGDDGRRCLGQERGARGQVGRRGWPRGCGPSGGGVRCPGDGTHRPDAAVDPPVGRLSGPGKGREDAATLFRQAHTLEELGCFSIVLECVPAAVASRITSELGVPTIGIGAGAGTDGQVLVLHDLWGVDPGHTPRFVRRYLDGDRVLTEALNLYDADVKHVRFPGHEESYT